MPSPYDIRLPAFKEAWKWEAWRKLPEYQALLPYDAGGPVPVILGSALSARRAVWTLARYFQREFRYDFVQYGHEGRDDDPKAVAFLWESFGSRGSHESGWVIGACCFRWREWRNAPHGWGLQWIWFHPYERRKGHLTRAWPYFRRQFGDFSPEPPLSEGMHRFLRKMRDSECPARTGP